VPRHATNRKPLWALFLVAGVTVAINASPAARHQIALSFTQQPEAYSELFFSQGTPLTVPRTANPESANVTFSIGNHEGKLTTYGYRVQMFDTYGAPVGDTVGSVDVPDGLYAAVASHVTVDAAKHSAVDTVAISLTGRSEMIRYSASTAKADEK
jgi:hypothetical protein